MKVLTALLILGHLLGVPSAYALEDSYSIQQGRTLEIRFPEENYNSVTGSFDGKKVPFYKLKADPGFDEPISRAEFIELLFLNTDHSAEPHVQGSTFPDVPIDLPQAEIIHKAVNRGIISGYENGNFGPYDFITRGQIAKILINTFTPNPKGPINKEYPDLRRNHEFYRVMQTAIGAGYFKGYPDGLMRPERSITFSEAETVIKRATKQEPLKPLGKKNYWRAFIGIHRLSPLGTKNLVITRTDSEKTSTKTISIAITKTEFPTVSFTLAPSKEELLDKEYQDTTWTQINAAKAHPNNQQLWDGPFQIPTNGQQTLGFGDKLYINGAYSGSHFGVDWANAEGTAVYASQNGIVTLAEWTDSYGNTIVIDHGQNIFTMYLHLSELKTKEGDTVTTGELIGLMGSTGVATGPHLHFTHFIGDIIVDSQDWFNGRW